MMRSLFLLSARRFHQRYLLQFILSAAGIALGVAVFVGVDVANTSANAAFESSAGFVRGTTTHRLLPVEGSLDERLYVELVASRGIVGAPIIDLPVRVTDTGAPANLLGVDAIEEAAFRDVTRLGMLGGLASETLITEPLTALVAPSIASDSTLTLRTQSGVHELQVVATLPQNSGIGNLVIVDIATAQEIADMIGRLSRIDLILDETTAAQLQASPPPGTVLVVAGSEDQAFRQLTNAFRINVLALSLLALAVGMFLVYSSANFSLIRRARMFAILRTLGMGRRELALSIVQEFVVLGLIASLIGVALGHVLADRLVDLMLLTVNDFSFRSQVDVSGANAALYLKGVLLGVSASLLATIAPLHHAVQRDANAALRRSAAESSTQRRSRVGLFLAIALFLIGAVLLGLPSRNLQIAFVGLFAVLAAAAVATPAISTALVTVLARLMRRFGGFIGLHATRNVIAQQSRIAVATAALMLAVACVIGVGVMIDSFRSSLQSWLDTTLTSDMYLSLDGNQAQAESLLDFLRSDPRVDDLSLTRFAEVPSEYGTLAIRAFEPGRRGWGIDTTSGDPQVIGAALAGGRGIAITEPFALRTGLDAGDSLNLPAGDSSQTFEILSVYRDYNANGASVLMSLSRFRSLWRDAGVDGIGVEVSEATELSAIEADIGRLLPPGTVRISTTTGIKRISLEIFDRTFLITEVLRILAGGIAFLGMLSALMALQLTRRREFSILRSIGFAPADLRRLIITETSIIGICAGAIAVPVGVLLSALLVFVINVRSFGWTMDFQVSLSALAPGFALAVAAAALAGVVPALGSYRHSVADGLRNA